VTVDHVADLGDELRIGTQLPGLHEVRLEAEGSPAPPYRWKMLRRPHNLDCESEVTG
jgi:hypothetical protein